MVLTVLAGLAKLGRQKQALRLEYCLPSDGCCATRYPLLSRAVSIKEMAQRLFHWLTEVRRRTSVIPALCVVLNVGHGWSQGSVAGRTDSVVERPEQISGVWETQNGTSVIGIDIEVTTAVKGNPTTLRGVEQFFKYAQIAVFERRGAEWAFGDANWFSTDAEGTNWSKNHLEMRGMVHPPKGEPEIAVDLQFDPGTESWSGRFHRGKVDRVVTLRRPHARSGKRPSPFVGTWKRNDDMNNCVHIAEELDGRLVAWSDDLIAPGTIRYANGLKTPAETLESYGSIVQINAQEGDSIALELKALNPTCCSIPMGGILSHDQRFIRSADNRADREWRRVAGDSCRPE